jgi:hypothetical protein
MSEKDSATWQTSSSSSPVWPAFALAMTFIGEVRGHFVVKIEVHRLAAARSGF